MALCIGLSVLSFVMRIVPRPSLPQRAKAPAGDPDSPWAGIGRAVGALWGIIWKQRDREREWKNLSRALELIRPGFAR